MARFEGDNPAYAAVLVLSMRHSAEGGTVRAPCDAQWAAGRERPQKDLLVLVHGFNNNRREAQDAYIAFRARQKAPIDTQGRERLEAMLGDAFWPGDAELAGPADLLDFLVYPATISRAKETADALSTYLRERKDVLNLNLVGHSMGCRVVLETIRRLLADPGFRTPIRKVCLMAAAVPTEAVLPGGALAPALLAAEQVQILFSPHDVVLSGAFPLGQTAAGDGFWPEAIGRKGNVPLSPGHVIREEVPDAGHGDYWGGRNNEASAAAAERIHRFLRIGVAGRDLAKSAPASRSAPIPRKPPPRREVGGS